MLATADTAALEQWLRSADNGSPAAVVLGGSVNGLSFVRSLGRRGISTLLLDSEQLIGMYTRYGNVELLPDPDEDPAAWLELLDFVGSRTRHAPVLFATSDVHGVFIARYAEQLGKQFRFLTPDLETQEQIVNKRLQYTIAMEAGIPIPDTYFPESVDEVRELAGKLHYPCILKSYKAHLGRKKIAKKVLVVDTAAELVPAFEEVATGKVQFMVQEIVPGEDDTLFGYLAFWDGEAHEHSWLTKQKLRQFPRHYGDGSLQRTVEAPEVRDLSRKLLDAFKFRGFVGTEFKYDHRDGSYRLMEINPRTVSGNQLAISAGVDFPWIGYRYLTGHDPGPTGDSGFLPGVKYINEEWDFKALLGLRSAGVMTLGEWFKSIEDVKARSIGATDDPYPLVMVLSRFLRAALKLGRSGPSG